MKLSLQFPPGVLHSSTFSMVPLHPFFGKPTVDILVFLSMDVRIFCIEAQDRVSVLSRLHVHQPSSCCCAARGVESFHLWIIMSELSGYKSASPLVALRNVFPSRCDRVCISRQFSSTHQRFRMLPSRQALSSCPMALTISSLTPSVFSSITKSSSTENSHGISSASTGVNPSTCKNLPPCSTSSRSSAVRA